MQKRILLVSHDESAKDARAILLLNAGYAVSLVRGDLATLAILETDLFDLVVIGRKPPLPLKGLDQRLREMYPSLPILKIAHPDEPFSPFVSQITDSDPKHILDALKIVFQVQDLENARCESLTRRREEA